MDEINPFTNPIRITCKAADTIPLEKIVQFQGNLKRLSSENREKLIKSICKEGFMAPIFIWKNNGIHNILDGTQRTKTLLYMQGRGWDIPELPVVFIEAENEAEARRKLLKITSQYGEFEMDELLSWIDDLDEDVNEAIRLVDEEMDLFLEEYDGSGKGAAEDDETYTNKINAPIYEITGEKPEIKEMLNLEKSSSLIEEINKADIEDPEIKEFLIAAAHRHSVFTYDKIAEFYAHSSAEIQDLMEKSALVIIDFDKAIEGGFVTLSKEMAELYSTKKEQVIDDE